MAEPVLLSTAAQQEPRPQDRGLVGFGCFWTYRSFAGTCWNINILSGSQSLLPRAPWVCQWTRRFSGRNCVVVVMRPNETLVFHPFWSLFGRKEWLKEAVDSVRFFAGCSATCQRKVFAPQRFVSWRHFHVQEILSRASPTMKATTVVSRIGVIGVPVKWTITPGFP